MDPVKLGNLVQRRKVYGDITQNTRDTNELETLLKRYKNDVPRVIRHLEERVWRKGTHTYIPPAFYDRDGTFYQPPSFEMKLSSLANTDSHRDQWLIDPLIGWTYINAEFDGSQILGQ